LWHGTLAPLALGVPVAAYAGRFDAARLMQAIEEFAITNLSAAATHYRLMKNAGVAPRRGVRLEKASFTGEPIDSATAAWAEATFGTSVCSIYGTTEIGVILANYPGAVDFAVKPGALGKPVPGVELAVHDPAGLPCPPGITGEIVVRRGDGWFPTQDRGHVDEDGYFHHDGRADDVIISAGWTMSPVGDRGRAARPRRRRRGRRHRQPRCRARASGEGLHRLDETGRRRLPARGPGFHP
jgi:acetyl-CoA synthetase